MSGAVSVAGLLYLAARLAAVVWLILLFARGGFWLADRRLGAAHRAPAEGWPAIAVLIPARNEAETIVEAVTSHLGTDYPGDVTVVLIDDGSEDGTGEKAAALRQRSGRALHVLRAPRLAPGWTGKLAALQHGLDRLADLAPAAPYVLLTDADIVHAPGLLARLVAKAGRERLDLVSLMARLDARGLWGGLLIPAFVFFFQKLYPFAWAADPKRDTAASAGGCALVRREALEAAGGFHPIRDRLIDDCALAEMIKDDGGALWIGLAREGAVSKRDNRSLGSVWTMVRRTAFTQLDLSLARLVLTTLAMAVLYVAPPAAVAYGALTWDWQMAAAGGLGWGLMTIAYRPTHRLYGRPLWEAPFLPLAAMLYTLMTVDSARCHLMGRGGQWKGRVAGSASHRA